MAVKYKYREGEAPGVWEVTVHDYDEHGIDMPQAAMDELGCGWFFTFDKQKIFSYWPDYPDNLTPEQIQLFNKAFPYWGEFKDWGGYPPDTATAQDSTPSIWDTRF